MHDLEQLEQENAALRERMAALTTAMLRIGADLDVTTVLREVVEGARALVRARYAVIVVIDEDGRAVDVVTSGLTEEEERQFAPREAGAVLSERLDGQPEPLRLDDLQAYVRSLGLDDGLMRPRTLKPVPMRHRDTLVGSLFLAGKEAERPFTDEDEEVLAPLAAQAAAAVANARAHRAERRARADLEALIETTPVGVAVFDARSGRPLSFNREGTRIIADLRTPGRSPEALLEDITARRADGQEMALDRLPLAIPLSSAETVGAEEIVLSLPDGRSVTTLLNATPIHAEDGSVASVVVTMQDLAPIQERERQRAEFLGLVSHELRAPLSAIKGSAATVLGAPTDLDPVETREFFRIVEEQADHMRALLADLLDTGRIETGTLTVAPEPTEVGPLLERARKTFIAGGGRHALNIDLPGNVPLVMADRQRTVQVINNLLANAARHAPASSPIRIDVACAGAHVTISVADDGVGVAPEQLPHLFQQHVSGGARQFGSGLGLAICKGLVEAHGGRISAESAGTGQGTRISFSLPTAFENAAWTVGAGTAAAGAAPRSSRKTRILAVDDDPRALRLVRDTLTTNGYTPVVTTDPTEVGTLIQAESPELVLLDLLFPDTDGIELMAQEPDLADVPVIFLSAYGRDETIARALEAGAADYIVKPFSPTELIARIQAALRRQLDVEPFRLGDLTIDYDERRVTVAGQPVVLTATEYELLCALSTNAGRVTTYETLQRNVWRGREHAGQGLVRTFVKKLRRKLGDDPVRPGYIENERGVGYRMPRPTRSTRGSGWRSHVLGHVPMRALRKAPGSPRR